MHEDATPPSKRFRGGEAKPPPPPTFSVEEQVINGVKELLKQEFEVDLQNIDVQGREKKFKLFSLKFHPDKWTAIATMGPVALEMTKFLNSRKDYYLQP